MKNYLIDWSRSVTIKGSIDESTVEKLSDLILHLRSNNSEPITIGIDSYGGSLKSMETILKLIGGPHQNSESARTIGVAINNAFSSAANLLALTDYAVAYPHSTIIFHDVRYQGIEDVTPEKAITTAKQLNLANDEFSLKLAKQVVSRLVWVYIDLSSKFSESKSKFPKTTKKFEEVVGKKFPISDDNPFDMVGFGVTLFRFLSERNDQMINEVFTKLTRWIEIEEAIELVPIVKKKGSKKAGLLDGVIELYGHLNKSSENGKTEINESDKETLSLLITLCVRRLSKVSSSDGLDKYVEDLVHDYNFVKNMKDIKHFEDIFRIMGRHSHVFFGKEKRQFDKLSKDDLIKVQAAAFPQVRIFWYFCVLLCRSLFDGEHVLSPRDAQLLGIIDEVIGGSLIQSRREFDLEKEKATEDKKKK